MKDFSKTGIDSDIMSGIKVALSSRKPSMEVKANA